MKTCSKCKEQKQESDFYKDKRTPDGLKCQCKKCHTETSVKTRDADKHRKANREHMKRAREKNPNKFRVRERKYSRIMDNKVRSRVLVNSLVKQGKLKKPLQCEECSKTARLTAHHLDYSKPLEVRWLCYECHGKKHRKAS